MAAVGMVAGFFNLPVAASKKLAAGTPSRCRVQSSAGHLSYDVMHMHMCRGNSQTKKRHKMGKALSQIFAKMTKCTSAE